VLRVEGLLLVSVPLERIHRLGFLVLFLDLFLHFLPVKLEVVRFHHFLVPILFFKLVELANVCDQFVNNSS